MEEHTLREGEGGSRPTRSARLERKGRASSLSPCTPHIQALLSHRHLAETLADQAGAHAAGKGDFPRGLLRYWLAH